MTGQRILLLVVVYIIVFGTFSRCKSSIGGLPKTEFSPVVGALVIPHNVKLAIQRPPLKEPEYSESARKGGEKFFRNSAAFSDFAGMHRTLILLVSIGIGIIGGFCFLAACSCWSGEFRLFHLLLFTFSGSLALCLVFALGHACYSR